MRILKFRAWDVRDRIMIYYNAGVLENSPHCSTTAMQYTGRHDRGGMDIYEGDILYGPPVFGEKTPITHVVVWDYDIEQSGGGGFASGFDMGAVDLKRSEIIGNIYEPPELNLKAGSRDVL